MSLAESAILSLNKVVNISSHENRALTGGMVFLVKYQCTGSVSYASSIKRSCC